MQLKKLTAAIALGTGLAGAAGMAQAASPTLYGDLASFLAGLGGAPTLSQDFEGYAAGANLMGVEVLPGVTLSTNLERLEVFDSGGDQGVFAMTRNLPEAEYDMHFDGSHLAFGFDVRAFDPATPGPAFLSFFFADGDLTYTEIPILPVNPTENDPLFFGIISDVALVGIRWSEGPEMNGTTCCEETMLDNMIVAAPVPEPATGLLFAGGAAALGLWRRRKAARD